LSAPWRTSRDFVSAIAYDVPWRMIPKSMFLIGDGHRFSEKIKRK
jgi:hypothetical protein